MKFIATQMKKIILNILYDKEFLFNLMVHASQALKDDGFREHIMNTVREQMGQEDIQKLIKDFASTLGIIDPIQYDVLTPQSRHMELVVEMRKMNKRMANIESQLKEGNNDD